jgi:hypothetical protein
MIQCVGHLVRVQNADRAYLPVTGMFGKIFVRSDNFGGQVGELVEVGQIGGDLRRAMKAEPDDSLLGGLGYLPKKIVVSLPKTAPIIVRERVLLSQVCAARIKPLVANGPPTQIVAEADDLVDTAARLQHLFKRPRAGVAENDVQRAQINPASGLLGSA